MSRRKAWDELTPTYRARLERKGIDASNHATKNLRQARGHDISLPHNTEERANRRRIAKIKVTKALAKIQGQERVLGYITDKDIVNAVGAIGIQGAQIMVDWHEYKHSIGVKKSRGLDKQGRPLPTFKEYVDDNYPGLWDDVYEDYWDYAQEIEGNGFYH